MATTEFSRDHARRILHIHPRSIAAWMKAGLLDDRERLSISDLAVLRALKRLRDHRVTNKRIREAVDALSKRIGVRRPLFELRLSPHGRRVAAEFRSARMDAMTGQLLLDFEPAPPGRARLTAVSEAPAQDDQAADAQGWFDRGLAIEESGGSPDEAAAAYLRAVECNPRAAGAWVNLGTLRYREGDRRGAERYYLQAVEASPDYPLALFNLGNIRDEQRRFDEALALYERAIELQPAYADAHYNLALLHERRREPMRAAKHWRRYLDLDPASPWAAIARRQLRHLLPVTPGGGDARKDEKQDDDDEPF